MYFALGGNRMKFIRTVILAIKYWWQGDDIAFAWDYAKTIVRGWRK
jgi:hypothetical protein